MNPQPPPDDCGGPARPRPALQPTHDTPCLFEPPAHRKGPETSRTAAKRIAGHSADQRAKVFACVAEAGAEGRTADEVSELLEMRAQSVTPRIHELLKLGVLRDSGQRRPTSSGRPARVLQAMTWPAETRAVEG